MRFVLFVNFFFFAEIIEYRIYNGKVRANTFIAQLCYLSTKACQFCENNHFEMNEIKLQSVSNSILGSTFPLQKLSYDEVSRNYDPFAHRKVTHPTT